MSASAPEPQRSLALRLTLWYTLSTMLLVSLAVSILYLALERHFQEADREEIDARLADLRNELAEGLSLDTLRRILSQENPTGHWQIRITDGELIIGETPGFAAINSWADFPPSIPTTHRPPVVIAKDPSGDSYVLSSQSTPLHLDNGISGTANIQVAFNDMAEQRLLAQYRLWIAAVLMITNAIAIGGGYMVARHGLGPIHRLTTAISKISADKLSTRLTTSDMPSEAAALALNFNTVLDRLEDSFARLAQFSGEIAHELRTPLNVLRNEIEVVLVGDRPAGDLRQTLASCLEEAERLGRLVDTLLLLARAENPRASLARQAMDMAAEVSLVAAFYQTAADDASITLLAECQPSPISGERVLLQRALGNLIENALAHTRKNGHITIRCIHDAKTVTVSVSDDGPGIAPEHLEKVFERFYRATSSEQVGGSRIGLGLAIVRSIARLHGGDASIYSTLGRGTIVEIHLPITES